MRLQLLDNGCFHTTSPVCPPVTTDPAPFPYQLLQTCPTDADAIVDVWPSFTSESVTSYFASTCKTSFKVVAQGMPPAVSITDLWRGNDDGTACSTYTVSFLPDSKPLELTWEFTGPKGNVIAAGGPYPTSNNGTTVVIGRRL